MLKTSNFSFCHNVFNFIQLQYTQLHRFAILLPRRFQSCLLQFVSCGKGLINQLTLSHIQQICSRWLWKHLLKIRKTLEMMVCLITETRGPWGPGIGHLRMGYLRLNSSSANGNIIKTNFLTKFQDAQVKNAISIVLTKLFYNLA